MAPPSPPILNSVPKARPTTLQFWWSPPTTGPVTGYRLQCIAASIDRTVSASEFTSQFTGLTDGTTYQFQIEAFNNDGYSDPAYFMPAQPGVISEPPTGIQVTTNGLNTNVSWTAPTTPLDIGAYWVTAIPSDAQSSNDYVVQSVPPTETYANMTNLNYISTPSQPDRSYTFNVRAYTSPGWSDQSQLASTTLNTVYGSYVTNSIALLRPATDVQGNQWCYIKPAVGGVDMKLYNRFGTLVQTIPAALVSTTTTTIIAYVSADGFTNCWMARISGGTTGILSSAGLMNRVTSLVDSEGNFIMAQQYSGTTTYSLFDKTNTLVRTVTVATTVISVFIIIKLSPTGIYSGSSDPNTWMVNMSGTSSLISYNLQGFKLDRNNNIIVSITATSSTPSVITSTIYDKNNTTIASFSLNPTEFGAYIIKIRSDGAATGVSGENSWRAYITTQSGSRNTYPTALEVNKYGQIIAGFSYKSTFAIVVGSDNTSVGGPLPFQSTMGTSSFTNTCLVRFCSTGQGASSWRAVQYSSSLGLSKYETPYSIHITSNDDIIYTMFSEGLSTNIPLFACDGNNDFSFKTFNAGFNNICMMKYTNDGSLQWLAGLRGNVSTIQPSPFSSTTTWFQTTTIYNGGGSSTNSGVTPYLFTTLDQQDNLVMYGIYYRAGFDFVNSNGDVIGQTASTRNTASSQTFVAKLSTNTGTQGWLAMQGYGSNNVFGSQFSSVFLPTTLAIDNSNHIVIGGQNYSTTTSYFVNSNMSTGYIRPQGYISTANVTGFALTRYDPLLSTVSSMVYMPTVALAPLQQFLQIDSQNNYITGGRYFSTLNQYTWFTSTNTISTLIMGISTARQGVFVGKGTNDPTTSWLGNIGNTSGNVWVTQQTPDGNQFWSGLTRVNLSTNRIQVTGSVSTGTVFLYNKNNSTVTQFGNSSDLNASTCTFFASYSPSGL